MYAATLAVVADWARALELPVALLQPRSADAHETPLNVRMVRTALQAKAVLAVGGGLEGYLPALQRATQGKTPIRTLLDHLRPAPDDLHIWLDLGYARQSCEQILRWAAQDGLLGLAQRQAWRRTELLFRQLAVQAREARATLQGKAYLAVHDAYRPLTQRLGMRSLGSLQPDHERPPSLQAFRDAIARARRARVAMVLCADESPLGTTAARLLQVPLVRADTLETPDPTRDYFTRMVQLLTALHQATQASLSNP